ncbi:MAG: DUF817 domain-containing protein [bacterium]|nr:DUF817 domain-containing protein [bacterium]
MLNNKLVTFFQQKFRHQATDARAAQWFKEFFAFGFKEVLSCLFPAFIFIALIVSKLIQIPGLPRYDFLLIACLLMQAFMVVAKLESKTELLVITMFHFIGLLMEIYKVSKGSWSYPEFAYTKVFNVPLYSGFMYASVGSYVCQAWRWFDLKIIHWPGILLASLVSLLIYANFFTLHYWPDLRWYITALLIAVFWNTKVLFTTNGHQRQMPLVLAFLCIGFFIWVGENMATFLGAWKYASQHEGWRMVSLGKISSWFLLIVLSIVIVTQLKLTREKLV